MKQRTPRTGKTILWLAGILLAVLAPISQAAADQIQHLKAPDSAADCYGCHKKATPIIAENWRTSKHGVILVKCFVCHGQPDVPGSVPWAVVPDPKVVCQKCHDPAMKRMKEKFGMEGGCYDCHRFHQTSLHHEAYKKSESKSQ